MVSDDTNVSTLQHFIDGARVAGESNRFGDIYNPATGQVQARVPFATAGEVDKAVQAAKAAFPGWAATPPRSARGSCSATATSSKRIATSLPGSVRPSTARLSTTPAARSPGHRDRRVRVRDPPAPQGRAQRERREPRRQLQHAPATGSVRRHHPVQFPGHGPDVDVSDRARMRQHLRAEAIGEGSVLRPAARRARGRSRSADRCAERRQRRQGGSGCATHPRGCGGGELRRLDPRSRNTCTALAPPRANGCRRSVERRTISWSCPMRTWIRSPTPSSAPPTARPGSGAWRSRSRWRSVTRSPTI